MTEIRNKIESDADMSNELKVTIIMTETLIEIKNELKEQTKMMREKEDILKNVKERDGYSGEVYPEYIISEVLIDIRDVLQKIELQLDGIRARLTK